jgi:hypothetical protein
MLLPIDVTSAQNELALDVADLLAQAAGWPSQQTVIFLDACFSGLGRGAEALATRGFQLKAKPLQPKGNTVLVTAAGASEAASAFPKARQGLFTYLLLANALQSSGESFGAALQALQSELPLYALQIHGREQHPAVFAAPALGTTWQHWPLSEKAPK